MLLSKFGIWSYIMPENDAEWVTLARKKLGLNQMELAYLTGVHNSVISRIENGNIPCTKKIRETLIRELGEKFIYNPTPPQAGSRLYGE